MPITLPHFLVSSMINLLKSAGNSAKGVPRNFDEPRLDSVIPAVITWFSLSITSAGVPFGAPTPYQDQIDASQHLEQLSGEMTWATDSE